MRKILFLCVLSLLPEVASAIKYYDAYIKGIYYLFSNDNTAKVSYEYSWPKGNVNAYSGDVVIPETVTYNGVKYNVTSIRDGAFAGCSKLNSVTMGNSITSIDKYAFSQSSVTSIILGNGVTELADRPLGYCPQLTTLVFGKDLTSIGAECVSTSVLKDIYCYAENPPACGNYALPTNSATLHVPESSLSKYKMTNFWACMVILWPSRMAIRHQRVLRAQTVLRL